VPLDLHEWISFEDDTHRRTWVFDATFLRSSWSCIYGNGCQGVYLEDASHLAEGCCSHGAHFIDEADVQTVVVSSARLKKRHWQFKKQGERDGILGEEDGVTTTRLVDGACIFLNRPGFEGGEGCALHLAAVEFGESPLDWKPSVCWQLPIRVDWAMQPDGIEHATVRRWSRADWGDEGDTMAWCCTSHADGGEAYSGDRPVIESLAEELEAVAGHEVFVELRRRLAP
jgi:hypothetical protein